MADTSVDFSYPPAYLLVRMVPLNAYEDGSFGPKDPVEFCQELEELEFVDAAVMVVPTGDTGSNHKARISVTTTPEAACRVLAATEASDD